MVVCVRESRLANEPCKHVDEWSVNGRSRAARNGRLGMVQWLVRRLRDHVNDYESGSMHTEVFGALLSRWTVP